MKWCIEMCLSILKNKNIEMGNEEMKILQSDVKPDFLGCNASSLCRFGHKYIVVQIE